MTVGGPVVLQRRIEEERKASDANPNKRGPKPKKSASRAARP